MHYALQARPTLAVVEEDVVRVRPRGVDRLHEALHGAVPCYYTLPVTT